MRNSAGCLGWLMYFVNTHRWTDHTDYNSNKVRTSRFPLR
jgi:hypothetical protein